ncbi:MAG: prolyl aminopeptidase [Gammaproteobacteria bacterium]|nr:prolyl aminopeptidase [Gammaproteobacteria bacterium]
MRELYPASKPYVVHTIKVDEPHVLHVEEYGNPDGLPVVFLHGGPGSGCEPYHSQFFDPDGYRIILFDQRGCGKSTPHAELEGNTTQALVADMEVIRQKLGIERWVVFGGSWGSTLALVYAQTHAQQVLRLILRGIFLCRPQEIAWFYQQGASRLAPDHWQDYLNQIPEAERDDMVSAYYRRLTSDDEVARMAAAKAWSVWEGRTATLQGRQEVVDHFADPYTALSVARIECHYFMHNAFLEDNQILRDMHKIKDIPGIIIHGRYDIICPLENAWELHQAWPQSVLKIIDNAGHAASEEGILSALIKASDKMLEQLAG